MIGEEIFKERDAIRSKVRNELKDILEVCIYSVSEIKEIDNEFIKAESMSLRIIEKIDLLLKKYDLLKRNVNTEFQASDISYIMTDIGKTNQILTQNLDNIINHLREAINRLSNTMEETTKINRSDVIRKIIEIIRNLDGVRSSLQTTKHFLSMINYYNNLFSRNNPNYMHNITIECQKTELEKRLKSIKESLIENIINKETKARRKLLLLRQPIENVIITI